MSKILALAHRKGVGKDSIARFIITDIRVNCQHYRSKDGKQITPIRIAFADKLKDIAYQLYAHAGHLPPEQYEKDRMLRDIVLPKIGKTVRQIWIDVGNRMREVYLDTWIDYIIYHKHSNFTIVTDLRFPNEVEKLRKVDAYIVRVDRPSVPYIDDDADRPLNDYNNKWWDEILVNDGSMQNLFEKSVQLGRKILEM